MIWLLYAFVSLAGVWAVWYASRPDPPREWVPPSRELMVEQRARAYHEWGTDWEDAYAVARVVVDDLLANMDEVEL